MCPYLAACVLIWLLGYKYVSAWDKALCTQANHRDIPVGAANDNLALITLTQSGYFCFVHDMRWSVVFECVMYI